MDKPPKCNGHTFTHVDARIVDEQGNEVGPETPGELQHRGPTVADGYFDRPEQTAETWDDGWFGTGDIAEMDADGFYHIHGRMDNMIISGGENIYPSEVEEALYSHPDIDEVVVFGVADETWGELVKAVVATPGDELTTEDISAFLDDRIAGYKHPKDVVCVDELPKSGTGKIERQRVQETYEEA